MGLQATTRDVDFKDVLSYELATISTSLFNNSGDMRLCTLKSEVKKGTHALISERNAMKIDCLVIDGCAILWTVQWPSSCSTKIVQVKYYVVNFQAYISKKLENSDVYLVFDRYILIIAQKVVYVEQEVLVVTKHFRFFMIVLCHLKIRY